MPSARARARVLTLINSVLTLRGAKLQAATAIETFARLALALINRAVELNGPEIAGERERERELELPNLTGDFTANLIPHKLGGGNARTRRVFASSDKPV